MRNTWGIVSLDGIQKTSGSRESLWNFYFGQFISPVFFMCEPPICLYLHSNYFALHKIFEVL